MTEDVWLTTNDTIAMYHWVPPSTIIKRRASTPTYTRRLASLFAVACVKATPQAEAIPFLWNAAGVVEHSADESIWDEVSRLETEAAKRCGEAELDSVSHFWALACLRLTGLRIDHYAMHVPLFLTKALSGSDSLAELKKRYADSLRDIAGNPFAGGRGKQFDRRKRKPQSEPVFRPEWRSDNVLSLARVMYERRDFDGMPVLADALQEAGCESKLILDHCRFAPLHVRGCWVVDLILGKE